MRVKLVLPDMGIGYTMNHGVTSIAAAIKQRGDECSLIHIDDNFRVGWIIDELEYEQQWLHRFRQKKGCR